MYVYRKIQQGNLTIYSVGFYTPFGGWVREREYDKQK